MSVAHQVVNGNKALKNHDPIWALGALQEKIGQSRNGHIGLFGTAKQIWSQREQSLHCDRRNNDSLSMSFNVNWLLPNTKFRINEKKKIIVLKIEMWTQRLFFSNFLF